MEIPSETPVVRVLWIGDGATSVAVSDRGKGTEDHFDVSILSKILPDEELLSSKSVAISPLSHGYVSAKKLCLRPLGAKVDNPTDVASRVKKELLHRILHEGNTVRVRFLGEDFTFKVDSLERVPFISLSDQLKRLNLKEDDYKFCEITLETDVEILTKTDTVETRVPDHLPVVGGVDEILKKIFTTIQTATDQTLTSSWVNKPSRGIVLYGPSGCGKSLICNYLSRCPQLKGCHFISILSSAIFSKYLGESEATLQKHFQQAKKNYPVSTVIVLEDLQIICKKNDASDLNRRLTSAILNCMDDLSECPEGSRTIVITTTTHVEDLDASLLRSGRFDSLIEVPIPTPPARCDILTKVLRSVPNNLSPDEIQSIANVTHGFLGADLVSLVAKAGVIGSGSSITIDTMNSALNYVKPSAMREILIEVPTVYWTDIGGQHELKLKLQQSVDWPLKNPEVFKRFGIKPPKGVLMYGPPGCSKTMIAKALATESQLNFLSIKGPELFSMWVGESERAVRELFRKARAVAPSIVFFDEIDAIGGERSGGGGGSGSSVNERVLAQLLTEMDGVTSLDSVTIVAATNRPDMIDKALLRPGRIDRVIHVRLPDTESRKEIFNIKLSNMPIGQDVDVEQLVTLTEGYSGAEIQAICQEAALKSLEESLEAEHIQWQHFLSALQVVKPRTSQELLDLYERYEEQFKERK